MSLSLHSRLSRIKDLIVLLVSALWLLGALGRLSLVDYRLFAFGSYVGTAHGSRIVLLAIILLLCS